MGHSIFIILYIIALFLNFPHPLFSLLILIPLHVLYADSRRKKDLKF
jgi:hypothetical protein